MSIRRLLVCSLLACAAPLAGAGADPVVITISKHDCSRLIAHYPSPDVAYRPGVDVRGRPVASAEADPARADFARRLMPDVLEFPLTINPVTFNKARAAAKAQASAQQILAEARTAQAASGSSDSSTAVAQAQAGVAAADAQAAKAATKGLGQTQMPLGTVRYDIKTGALTFNGEPMVDDDQRRLAEACAAQQSR
jgi:hypothetical protein